jgi:hypothetical protein
MLSVYSKNAAGIASFQHDGEVKTEPNCIFSFYIAMSTFQQESLLSPRYPSTRAFMTPTHIQRKTSLTEHMVQRNYFKTVDCASGRGRRQCGFVRNDSHGSKYIDYTRLK